MSKKNKNNKSHKGDEIHLQIHADVHADVHISQPATSTKQNRHHFGLFHRRHKPNFTEHHYDDRSELEIKVSSKELKRGFFSRLFRHNKSKKMRSCQEQSPLLPTPNNR